MTVKKFNREAYDKWAKAANEYRSSKGGYPSLAMYLYVNQNTGEPKKVGYVGITKYGSVWGRTKKLVQNKLKKVM